MSISIQHIHQAQQVLAEHMSPAPLIRSYALERALKLPSDRRVWIKDYGWTPVGSFKLMGALFWMSQHVNSLEGRPVAAHSSGNFASGLSYAGYRFGSRVIIVMPESAPKIKFENTRRYGAEVRTYDISTDHLTGVRDRLAKEIAEQERALQASPYDDPFVIAGNGVGGLEIVQALKSQGRELSHFVCAVSGGGLMAGHALAIADGFPEAKIVGVEPDQADDFRQSRIERRYDVGEHNWPILERLVTDSVVCSDEQTKRAMGWLYRNHGLRTEPSGAITTAAILEGKCSLDLDAKSGGKGDIVVVLSGRNIDEDVFARYLADNDLSDHSSGVS